MHIPELINELICFGARPGEGNPALVIEGGDPSPEARQRLARERNTTCVFIDEDRDKDGGTVRVDYWYPHMRSPLCLHATLAVAAVLFRRTPDASVIAVETAMQGQRLALLREGDDYFVRLAAQPAPQVDVTPGQAAALLGAAPAASLLAAPPRVASIGSPKLLVEVQDAAALYALQPDLAWISAWGRQHGINGIYAWCRCEGGTNDGGANEGGVYEGRNFNHLDPALEDAATGVAAGALSAALGRSLVLYQGRAVGRDCLIRTRIDGPALLVGGAVAFM
nr:PhzF family phenazine biosynthesis protein [uncultured Massilia sp.]